jgi:hypothetical protein
MSEQTQPNSQQTIVIALAVIAVLLAAIVGVLIYQQSQNAKLAATSVTAETPAATPSGAPAGMGGSTGGTAGGAAATAPTTFDAKTATKVPAGMTPVQLVKAYNEAVIAGKFAEAYKLLPVDKQKSYGDATAYGAQVKAYGITTYNMGTPVETADSVSVAAEQVTPQMPITYTWEFKKVGGQWYVASRNMGGSVK